MSDLTTAIIAANALIKAGADTLEAIGKAMEEGREPTIEELDATQARNDAAHASFREMLERRREQA